MRIETNRINNIIQDDAWFYITDHALNIIINTVERYVFPDCTEFTEDSVGWLFFTEDSNVDFVKVFADTEEDKNLIRGIIFECHCKDQFHYLIPKEEVFIKNIKKVEQLGE